MRKSKWVNFSKLSTEDKKLWLNRNVIVQVTTEQPELTTIRCVGGTTYYTTVYGKSEPRYQIQRYKNVRVCEPHPDEVAVLERYIEKEKQIRNKISSMSMESIFIDMKCDIYSGSRWPNLSFKISNSVKFTGGETIQIDTEHPISLSLYLQSSLRALVSESASERYDDKINDHVLHQITPLIIDTIQKKLGEELTRCLDDFHLDFKMDTSDIMLKRLEIESKKEKY